MFVGLLTDKRRLNKRARLSPVSRRVAQRFHAVDLIVYATASLHRLTFIIHGLILVLGGVQFDTHIVLTFAHRSMMDPTIPLSLVF